VRAAVGFDAVMDIVPSIARGTAQAISNWIAMCNVTLQIMVFRVLIFGSLARELSCASIAVDVPDNASARDVNEALAARYPHKSTFFRGARLAVNHTFQSAETPLRAGDEIAVIELVGGG
jgi:molybdopterin converting factor small subunit